MTITLSTNLHNISEEDVASNKRHPLFYCEMGIALLSIYKLVSCDESFIFWHLTKKHNLTNLVRIAETIYGIIESQYFGQVNIIL